MTYVYTPSFDITFNRNFYYSSTWLIFIIINGKCHIKKLKRKNSDYLGFISWEWFPSVIYSVCANCKNATKTLIVYLQCGRGNLSQL